MATVEFIGILAAIISVGIALATLIIRGQHRTDARFDAMEVRTDARFDAMEVRTDSRFNATDNRMSGVETGLARVEGFLVGAGYTRHEEGASSPD